MRRILLLLALLIARPAVSQSGPQFGQAGGIGASNCTIVSGEPTGGTCTYSINGSTGAAKLGAVTAGAISASSVSTTGLATLGNITTPGYLQVGSTAAFGDLNYVAGLSGGAPYLQFSPNNSLRYDRTANVASINIGGTPRFSVSSTGVSVPGDLAWQTTSSNINGATSKLGDASSVLRTFLDRVVERTSVMDFCQPSQVGLSAATNATDTCVQNAVTAICARATGGGVLYFPPGFYRFDQTVTLSCAGLLVEGVAISNPYDSRGTHIVAGHRTDTAPVFKALVTSYTSAAGETGAPSNQSSTQRFSFGPVFRNMTFENLNGSVSSGRRGPFIELNYTTYSLLDHVTAYASCTALRVNGGFSIGVVDSQLETFEPNCNTVELRGDLSKTFHALDIVYFRSTDVTTFGGGGACYDIQDRVQTVWWTNTACETGGYSIHATCPTMTNLKDCHGFYTLQDFESESFSTSNNMIELRDLADGFNMSNGWMRGYYGDSAANNMINIVPDHFVTSATGYAEQGLPISISNNWFKQAGGSCLYIQSRRASITGNHIYGCGRRADGPAYAAVEIRSNYATVTGNTLCGDDYLHDASTFSTGVLVSNNANYVAITGNVIMGGCTSAYLNTGTGTAVAGTGNVGP